VRRGGEPRARNQAKRGPAVEARSGRARGEEPRNEKELAEERGRFVDAVLRAALPAPSPAESWYLARIYRGNAMTV